MWDNFNISHFFLKKHTKKFFYKNNKNIKRQTFNLWENKISNYCPHNIQRTTTDKPALITLIKFPQNTKQATKLCIPAELNYSQTCRTLANPISCTAPYNSIKFYNFVQINVEKLLELIITLCNANSWHFDSHLGGYLDFPSPTSVAAQPQ